jgi:hypothetical protein
VRLATKELLAATRNKLTTGKEEARKEAAVLEAKAAATSNVLMSKPSECVSERMAVAMRRKLLRV